MDLLPVSWSYDHIKLIQTPFTLSTEDLMLISHEGLAKVISISDLSRSISAEAYTYVEKTERVPTDTDKVVITGSFENLIGLRATIKSTEGNEVGISIVKTIVNPTNITFILSGTTFDSDYVIDYFYSEKSKPFYYGKILLNPGSDSIILENKNLMNLDTIYGVIKTPEGEVLKSVYISNVVSTPTQTTILFSDIIPDNGNDYILEYKYSSKNIVSNAYTLKLSQGDINATIEIDNELDDGYLIANIYYNDVMDNRIYITDISRTGNTVVFTFSKAIPDNINYKLMYYFVK